MTDLLVALRLRDAFPDAVALQLIRSSAGPAALVDFTTKAGNRVFTAWTLLGHRDLMNLQTARARIHLNRDAFEGRVFQPALASATDGLGHAPSMRS
jgi:hypothetical protein